MYMRCSFQRKQLQSCMSTCRRPRSYRNEGSPNTTLRSFVTSSPAAGLIRLSTHPTLVLTRRGSRPGDPLADILFAFTLSAYLRRLPACCTPSHSRRLELAFPTFLMDNHSATQPGRLHVADNCPRSPLPHRCSEGRNFRPPHTRIQHWHVSQVWCREDRLAIVRAHQEGCQPPP